MTLTKVVFVSPNKLNGFEYILKRPSSCSYTMSNVYDRWTVNIVFNLLLKQIVEGSKETIFSFKHVGNKPQLYDISDGSHRM